MVREKENSTGKSARIRTAMQNAIRQSVLMYFRQYLQVRNGSRTASRIQREKVMVSMVIKERFKKISPSASLGIRW